MAGNPVRRQQTERIVSQLEELCELIAAGESDKAAMQQLGWKDAQPLYAAEKREPAVAAALARAREDGAKAMASSVIDIADELQLEEAADPVRVAQLRIEGRKWLAAKRNREAFGDNKTNVAVQVNVQSLHLTALKGSAPAALPVIEAEVHEVLPAPVDEVAELL